MRNIIKKMISAVFRIRAKIALSNFSANTGRLKLFSEVIQDTLNNENSEEEKKWINKIEVLRGKLDSSHVQISLIDYGAGEANFNFSKREMEQGRNVTSKISELSRSANKSYFWLILLFRLIRKFKPLNCLELGTGFGISTAYQAAALSINGGGKITSIEGAETLASLSESHLRSLNLNNFSIVLGKFNDKLPELLKKNSFDFVFIDGHHTEEATVEYFRQIRPYLAERSIIVFDDISWTKGMKRAWKTILENNDITISIDLLKMGLVYFEKGSESRKHISIPLI